MSQLESNPFVIAVKLLMKAPMINTPTYLCLLLDVLVKRGCNFALFRVSVLLRKKDNLQRRNKGN